MDIGCGCDCLCVCLCVPVFVFVRVRVRVCLCPCLRQCLILCLCLCPCPCRCLCFWHDPLNVRVVLSLSGNTMTIIETPILKVFVHACQFDRQCLAVSRPASADEPRRLGFSMGYALSVPTILGTTSAALLLLLQQLRSPWRGARGEPAPAGNSEPEEIASSRSRRCGNWAWACHERPWSQAPRSSGRPTCMIHCFGGAL